jgi:superfamily II DNA/RNA helicase
MKKLVLILVTLVATISLTGCMNVLDSGNKQGTNAAFIFCEPNNSLEFVIKFKDSSEIVSFSVNNSMSVIERTTEYEDLNGAIEERLLFYENNGRICQRVTL